MPALLPHSICYHMPKTGGTWVIAALKEAKVPFEQILCVRGNCPSKTSTERVHPCCKHATPAFIDPSVRDAHFSFVFIRNPFSIYKSFWCYKMRMGWDPKDPFDVKYSSDDFGDFVRTITKERPGWISKKIENYVGKEGESLVNFVGRQESLVEDLVRALTLAGEEFDEAALRATPKVNETASLDEWKDKAVFTPELIDLVRRSEQEALKRFGYDFEGAVLSA